MIQSIAATNTPGEQHIMFAIRFIPYEKLCMEDGMLFAFHTAVEAQAQADAWNIENYGAGASPRYEVVPAPEGTSMTFDECIAQLNLGHVETEPSPRIPAHVVDDLEAALCELIDRIKAGAEFPDITWGIARAYRVSQEELESAYDEACALGK